MASAALGDPAVALLLGGPAAAHRSCVAQSCVCDESGKEGVHALHRLLRLPSWDGTGIRRSVPRSCGLDARLGLCCWLGPTTTHVEIY